MLSALAPDEGESMTWSKLGLKEVDSKWVGNVKPDSGGFLFIIRILHESF